MSIFHKNTQTTNTWKFVLALFVLIAVLHSAASANTTLLENKNSQTQYEALSGMWRGSLEVQPGIVLPIGINISADGKLTLDSPNQEMYQYVPSKFEVGHTQISFSDSKLKASYLGEINKDVITGTFTQGKEMSLVLHKLKQSDIERLEFEAKYGGDLVISANQSLPLVLRVAVVKNGYVAVLDSPAQNSFGIPITNIDINDSTLEFTSTMLGAKFSGKITDSGYSGTFTQGQAMSLTLDKITIQNAHKQFKQPKFGEHGGSIAIIEKRKDKAADGVQHSEAFSVQTRFYGNHNANTQYEIGSITKTFTAYLLALAQISGDVSPKAQLADFFTLDKNISLKSLATHTSGLPRNPQSIANPLEPLNPFDGLSREDLANDLQNTTLGDGEYLYSNFAYSALAEALAIQQNTSYTALVKKNIFEAFDMQNSYVAFDKSNKNTLAQGHNTAGKAMNPWHFNAASGAGAVVSTLEDMILYTKQMMVLAQTHSNLAEQLFTPQAQLSEFSEQALGWMIMKDEQGKPIAWHNGMTGGFSSYLGFYLDGSKAVILLNNQATSINQLALKLLND